MAAQTYGTSQEPNWGIDMKHHASHRFVTIILTLFAAMACGGPDKLGFLDSTTETASSDVDAERHRLQNLQLVHYVDQDGNEGFMPAIALNNILSQYCDIYSLCPGYDNSSECFTNVCNERQSMCTARYLQSVALIRAEPLKLQSAYRLKDNPSTNDLEQLSNYDLIIGDFLIPPQRASSKAAIMRLALSMAESSLDRLTTFDGLQCEPVGDINDAEALLRAPERPLPSNPDIRVSGLWSQSIVEAHELLEDLSEDAVDNILAAADAQRSTATTTAQGAARSIAGYELSRAEAAHLLIGGDPGLLGSTTKAFCGSPELGGTAKAALDVLRRAAPDPDDVANGSLDLATFLNGSLAGFSRGSIATRTALLDGRTVPSIEEYSGLPTEAFIQARSYLKQELKTFARDRTVTFTPNVLDPDGIPSGVIFHAATAREPIPLPPEYFAALARYWTDEGPRIEDDVMVSEDIASHQGDALARVRSAAGMRAPYEEAVLSDSLDDTNATQFQFQGPLKLLVSRDPRAAHIRWNVQFFDNSQTNFLVDGFRGEDGLRLVDGLSGLLCATTGEVEGEPCDQTRFDELTSVVLADTRLPNTSFGPVRGGYTYAASGVEAVDWNDLPRFVVVPRVSTVQEPGRYQVLAGFVLGSLPKVDAGTPIEYGFAVFPELEKKAGDILRPSSKWCTRSAVECDGTLFDERMPLENELSEDHDDVESSWRHFLDLAEQAAAEAHLLGEQYLQNGLEVDRELESEQLREAQDRQRYLDRVDGEMEVLQDICGTAMDTSDLLGLLGGEQVGPTGGLFCDVADDCCGDAVGPTTTCPYECNSGLCIANECSRAGTGEDTGCDPPYQCIGQRCVYSPIAVLDEPDSSEGLSRLRECIGTTGEDGRTVLPTVALGDQPLCVWGADRHTCEGASVQFPCPVSARRDPAGQLTCAGRAVPEGQEMELVVDRLNLVDASALVTGPDPCDLIRQQRLDGQSCTLVNGAFACDDRKELFDYLTNSFHPAFFGVEHFAHAARIGWRAELPTMTIGNAASVLVDNAPRWSTGPLGVGSWPCTSHSFYGADIDCTNASPDSLFCQTVPCGQANASEVAQVSAINQRLLDAVMVLQGLTDGRFDKVSLPFQVAQDPELLSQALSTGVFGNNNTQNLGGGRFRVFDNPTNPNPSPPFWVSTPAGGSPVTYNVIDEDASTMLLIAPLEASPRTRFTTTPLFRHLFGLPDAGTIGGLIAFMNDNNPIPQASSSLTQPSNYSDGAVSDALELLCEATRSDPWSYQPEDCVPFDPAAVQTEAGFAQVKDYARCEVQKLQRAMGGIVLHRFPARAAEGIADFSVEGVFPVGGQMGEQLLRLRAALTRYTDHGKAMVDAAQRLNDAIDAIAVSLKQVGLRSEIDENNLENAALEGDIASLQVDQAQLKMKQIELQQTLAWINAAVKCAQAMTEGASGGLTSFGASVGTSAVTCGLAFGAAYEETEVLSYEHRIANLENQIANKNVAIAGNNEESGEFAKLITQLDAARLLIEARGTVRGALREMGQIQTEAQASLDEIRASLLGIESLRLKAQRAVQRSLQFETTQAGVTENIERVLNAKLNVSKERYLQAHKNAVRLAFLAKRAIEQRLGVHLSELRADMPLVDAPSSWEAEVCSAETIDYDAIRATAAESGEAPPVPVDFSSAYIGDYVTKLRNVVESYRLQYDFHEGSDQVVTSLRDDVLNVRAPCSVFPGNLLRHSGDLGYLVASGGDGWSIQGCEVTEGGVSAECLAINTAPSLTTQVVFPVPGAEAFEVTWGSEASSATALVQEQQLEAGRYRLSWYSEVDGAGQPDVDVVLTDSSGTVLSPLVYDDGMSSAERWNATAGPLGEWRRHYRIFDLEEATVGAVAIVPNYGSSLSPIDPRTAGGIMLELVGESTEGANPELLQPRPFVATTGSLEQTLTICEDTDGEVFRSANWEYRCTKLCTDGFSENCLDSALSDRCFWEIGFSLDQRDLEAGRIFAQSGFARGNFNYRIEDVAVNFVGTGVRDCADSQVPSTCFAAGFVPYSLKHTGPLFVRNHVGADFPVSLFNGNIEHARGLGTERYLTNPLSSADRELLEPYMRREFNGRPLDGNFVLRVWDEEGVDFSAIADVQLFLRYRYWTRFD